ncbi:WD domain, G-beta repeat-containing protein [Spironucleus salmonicida]|uniref:WD domain, G-beta repeat-containing protein n=1 Tax=Spironucleus salmonicida TaxID=348837 RepID=V6LJ57_9EUKA|nr:WD domain, G-beta repeat-containing protein [Spironucleus salmonicida]|eukprot:EST44645.1 WD domain, G-beta repeat-containing protein [Spironucleus salmonicida]
MTALDPQILQLYSAPTNYTIYGSSWIPQSARFLSVGMAPKGTGQITVWGFDDQKLTKITQHEKQSALKCVSFGASITPQRHFATGDHDGNLFVYDVENLSKPVFQQKAHNAIVHCVDGIGGKNVQQTGAPEIATGGADGLVKLWDTRMKDPVLVFGSDEDSQVRIRVDQDKVMKITPECWSVALGGATSTSDRYLATGFDSGDLKMIDLRMMKVAYEHHFSNGICSLDFDRQDTKLNKLYIGTLEGHTYTMDLAVLNENTPITDFKPWADSSTVWQVKSNPFNRDTFLATAGSKIGLCKYNYPKERVRKTDKGEVGVGGNVKLCAEAVVTSQTVQSISWNREKQGLIGWGAMDQTVNIGFISNLNGLD